MGLYTVLVSWLSIPDRDPAARFYHHPGQKPGSRVSSWLEQWDYTRSWFHGSPYQIETLLPGSTITQDKNLARIFSHKPQIVSLEDDPDVLARGVPRIRHNGALSGLLYIIDEPLRPVDVYPHPRSSMPAGLEWLTCRPICLRLLGPVAIDPVETLTPEEIDAIMKRMKGKE